MFSNSLTITPFITKPTAFSQLLQKENTSQRRETKKFVRGCCTFEQDNISVTVITTQGVCVCVCVCVCACSRSRSVKKLADDLCFFWSAERSGSFFFVKVLKEKLWGNKYFENEQKTVFAYPLWCSGSLLTNTLAEYLYLSISVIKTLGKD